MKSVLFLAILVVSSLGFAQADTGAQCKPGQAKTAAGCLDQGYCPTGFIANAGARYPNVSVTAMATPTPPPAPNKNQLANCYNTPGDTSNQQVQYCESAPVRSGWFSKEKILAIFCLNKKTFERAGYIGLQSKFDTWRTYGNSFSPIDDVFYYHPDGDVKMTLKVFVNKKNIADSTLDVPSYPGNKLVPLVCTQATGPYWPYPSKPADGGPYSSNLR